MRWTSPVRFKMLLVIVFFSWTQGDRRNYPELAEPHGDGNIDFSTYSTFHSAMDGKRAHFPWPGTKYYNTTVRNRTKTDQFANKSEFQTFLREKDDTVTIKWIKEVNSLMKGKRVLEVTSFGRNIGKIVRKAGAHGTIYIEENAKKKKDKYGQNLDHKRPIWNGNKYEWAGTEILADIFWFIGNRAVGCYKEKGEGKGTCWRRWYDMTVDGDYCYPRNRFGGHYVECSTHYDCIKDQRTLDYTCYRYWWGGSQGTRTGCEGICDGVTHGICGGCG